MNNHLLTNAEFCILRDELALTAMNARLPVLKTQLAALWCEIKPIFEAYYRADKHGKAKVYARFEGRDILYWRLVSEMEAIEARLVGMKGEGEK